MSKVKLYVVLGDATGYNDAGECGDELGEGCGSMVAKTFNTKAEADAYLEGLEDMSGLEDYQVVNKEFYDKALTIANHRRKV